MNKNLLNDIIISLQDVGRNINQFSLKGTDQWQLATQCIGVLSNIANAVSDEIKKMESEEE